MFNHEAKVLSIIKMVSCPISFIASSTIIVMIARSSKKLSTTQNRLLVGLSISDLIISFSQSFASVAIPKDTTDTWIPLGNWATCDAQAFLISMGAIMTPCYNAGICVYFLLKVRYNLDDTTITRRCEPFLHFVPIVMALSISIDGLLREYANPAATMCYFSEYPMGCSSLQDVPCERGEGVYRSASFRISIVIIYMLVPAVIFTSMMVLFITVKSQEQRMSDYGVGSLRSVRNNRSIIRQSTYVRKVLVRGFAYSGAWLLTNIFPFVFIILTAQGKSPSYALRILVAIFFSLQGLFNFMVFIYPKICHAWNLAPDISFFRAFMEALKSNVGENVRVHIPYRQGHNSMVVRDVENVNVDASDSDIEADPPLPSS